MTYRAPHLDPEAWDSAIFTDVKKQTVTLPPRPICGKVKVSLPSKIKVDSKKAAGKSGATVTRQGAADATVTIEFEFASQYYSEVIGSIDALDPRGPSAGGPFLLTCPNLPGKFEALQIESVDPRGTAMIQRGMGRVKIVGKECVFPKPGASGGGAGSGKKKLSEFDRAAIQFSIDLLEQRIRTDAALGATRTGAELQEISDRIASNRAEINRLKKQLESGAASSGFKSETHTPVTTGETIGDAVQNAFEQIYNAGSYSPTSNPAAPSGAP